MLVTANGKPREVDDGVTVAAFLRSADLDPDNVAVERNGDALTRSDFERTVLADGDRLEIVKAVAGG